MDDQQGRKEVRDIEALYGEDIQLDYESELHELVQNLWGSPRNIDWSQQRELSDGQREVLVRMATHFSYNNVAELSLCGTILEQEYFLQPKMIASIIAVSKIRNLQTWNKYQNHMGELADVPEPDKKYFSELPEQENMDSLLLGMSVIGKITWMALADELDDIGDPVFDQILDTIRQQKQKKLDLVREHLQKSIAHMTDDELQQLHRDARFYRGQARETVIYHDDALATIGKNTQQIANHVEDGITDFYDDVGIVI